MGFGRSRCGGTSSERRARAALGPAASAHAVCRRAEPAWPKWARRGLATAFAASAVFLASEFLWTGRTGARLPLAEGYRHVVETHPLCRLSYEVADGPGGLGGREWLVRRSYGGGGCSGPRESLLVISVREDGLHIGGPPSANGAATQLLLPAGLRAKTIWRVGRDRVTCSGREWIVTRYGLCRALRLAVEDVRSPSSDVDLWYVPGLGVPLIRFVIPLDEEAGTRDHAVASVRIRVPGRRVRLGAAGLLMLASLGPLIGMRRLRG